jgi:hypothetical protein
MPDIYAQPVSLIAFSFNLLAPRLAASCHPLLKQRNQYLGSGLPQPIVADSNFAVIPAPWDAPGFVMRGLDPRIHPSSQESFPRRMDCRVKPGTDVRLVTVPVLRSSVVGDASHRLGMLHRVRATRLLGTRQGVSAASVFGDPKTCCGTN